MKVETTCDTCGKQWRRSGWFWKHAEKTGHPYASVDDGTVLYAHYPFRQTQNHMPPIGEIFSREAFVLLEHQS